MYTIELTRDGLIDGIPLISSTKSGQVQFDQARLRELVSDDERYGRLLSAQLFASEELKNLFIEAYEKATGKVAFRLWLDFPDDSPLENIIWERLWHPSLPQPICTTSNALISRCRGSIPKSETHLRPKPVLSALGVVAGPRDLNSYGYATIDVVRAVDHFNSSFRQSGVSLQPTILSSGGQITPTWENIKRQLLKQSYQILYIACHGEKSAGQTALLLENAQGETEYVSSNDIANFIEHELQPEQRPLLVFLASCYSIGDGYSETPLFLGSRLMRAGILAVVGFQDSVSFETVAQAVPVFFQQLLSHGRVGRALNQTRAVLRPAPGKRSSNEWWKLSLFLNQRTDQLWHELPDFEALRSALADYFARALPPFCDQPGQDELNALAISIAYCPGFQERVGEMLEILRIEANGFSQLMQRLYSRDAGSVQFARLEHTLSHSPTLTLARSVPWSALFKLLALLKQIEQAEITIDEEVRRFYHRNIEDQPVSSGGHGIVMQWRVIEDLSGRSGDPPLLVALVKQLAGLPKLTFIQPRLRAWLQDVAVDLGQAPDHYDRVERARVQTIVPNARLLLILEPTGGPQHDAWKATVCFTPDESRPELWDREFIPVDGTSLLEFPASLEKVLDLLDKRLDSNQDLHIEIALPDGWLFKPFDADAITRRDEPEPLGCQYHLVVRSASRLLEAKHRTRRDWVRRWESWCRIETLDEKNYLWLDSFEACEPRKVERQLHTDEHYWLSCVVGKVMLADEQHELLARKLTAHGIPVILWYRGPHNRSKKLARILKELLAAGRNLPDRLYELRRKAQGGDAAHAVGRHLVLLWDDPLNLPRTFNPALSALE